MKGLSLTSLVLASLLAFSGMAFAQDSSDMDTTPDGVDSAADVDPGEVQGDTSELEDELAPNSGVDSAQDVDPEEVQGDTDELPEEELAPDSGVDSAADVDPADDDKDM